MSAPSPTVAMLTASICAIGSIILSGCGSLRKAPLPTIAPEPAPPSLEVVWQRHRAALQQRNIPDLLVDYADSCQFTYWVENETGYSAGQGGSGTKGIGHYYGELVDSNFDENSTMVGIVDDDETRPRTIFYIWSGTEVDFASIASIFDDRSQISHQYGYILKTSAGPGLVSTADVNARGTSVEPHQSMERSWQNRDIDGLMELYREDSKVLYFDGSDFQISKGIAEIRSFFENTNLTVPFIQPKSLMSKSEEASPELCAGWVRGFHGDGQRRLSMLMRTYRERCAEPEWIQMQFMGFFDGEVSESERSAE